MLRITYLDGLRGIAILLVIIFHAYSRWPELVPYGDISRTFPLFQYGQFGVQLFFIISGFVILMTLEKCKGFCDFIYRRWLRLFPAMLICSVLIFSTVGFFYERPNGQPSYQDLIPGLVFIDPYILGTLTGISFNSIENSFWSLYVEFQFYIFAGILYFLLGKKLLILAIFCAFVSSFVFLILNHYFGNSLIQMLFSLTNNIMSFKYFGWFAAGSAFYMYSVENEKKWFYYALVIALISCIATTELIIGDLIAVFLITALFALSVLNPKLQHIISNKIFLAFGFVSYPLYLLHENMMIASIIKMNAFFPSVPSFTLPVFAVIFIFSLAFIISRYLEKPSKNLIKAGVSSLPYT